MRKSEIVKTVAEEIKNPILGTTEQILKSHQVLELTSVYLIFSR